jgi:hypothetical protein
MGSALSDASHGGLGGWSQSFLFMSRLLNKDLLVLGYNMRIIDKTNRCLAKMSQDGLHINLLEFVAVIINIWLIIFYVLPDRYPTRGAISDLLADNTYFISWMRYAARSHSIPVRNLAYLCLSILILSQTSDHLKLKGRHLAGKLNGEADALSIPEIAPMLACATRAFYRLQSCRACQLPYGLLSCISRLLSLPKIAASSAGEMMELLAVEPVIFDVGVPSPVCKKGYC